MFLSFVHDCGFNHLVQFQFSFQTFLTAFVPRICLFFHSGSALRQSPQRTLSTCLEADNFPTYRASSVGRLLRQVAASGTWPCHTILCFATFPAFRSWLALKLRYSFSLSTNLSRLGEDHEDEMDTRCMVTEWKGAATSSITHSLSRAVIDVITNTRPILPTRCSCPSFYLVFCTKPQPRMSTCTTSVCQTFGNHSVNSFVVAIFIPCFPMFGSTLLIQIS